jgi:hypothetical protein
MDGVRLGTAHTHNESFETLAALTDWCADHAGPECAGLFNSIFGVKPAARFENRDIAASRIWKAIAQPADRAARAGGDERPATRGP